MFTKEKMGARFAELQTKRASILAVSMPLRESRDSFVNEAKAEEKALNDEIHKAETGLFDIDMEISLIAKALGGHRLSAATAKA